MAVRANIVKNKTIGVDLNQKAGGFNAPVQSVNSKTGDVILDANDVGADPEGTAEEKVSEHNIDTEAHSDIRALIQGLTSMLNTLADSDDTTLDQMSELVAYIKSNRSLIEGITTNKVNVSDIVNNLTTQIANRPLSANQGYILKEYVNDLEADKANKATTLAGYGITDGVTNREFEEHTSDDTVHITANERTAWNAKADTSSIPTKTSQLTNDSGFLTAVPSGYVTEEELEDKGYLTDVPDEYVTETELNNKGYLTAVPSGYVTRQEINEAGYATEAKINRGLYGLVKSVNNITPDIAGNVNIVGEDGSIARRYTWDDIAQGSTMIDLVIDSDGVNYGGYHKVSDEVPTLEQLQKGGTISFDEGTGNGIVTMNYPEGDIAIMESTNGAAIVFNGLKLAVVAYEDGATILGNTFEKGISFAQNDYVITHSLMIKDYPADGITPIPVEYLPESHQFGEETVMGDTLTWDGDMTGKVYVEMEMPIDDEGNTTTAYFVKVSDTVPTFEDLQSGGTIIVYSGGESAIMPWGNDTDLYYIDAGNVILDETMELPMIVKEDNTDLTETLGMPLVFPEKGIYFINIPLAGMIITSFTINNYTGFETTEIKPIDPKYLSFEDAFRTCFYSGELRQEANAYKLYVDDERTTLATYQDIENAYKKGQIVIIENVFHYFPTSIRLVPPYEAILVVVYDKSGATDPTGTETTYKRYRVGSAD